MRSEEEIREQLKFAKEVEATSEGYRRVEATAVVTALEWVLNEGEE